MEVIKNKFKEQVFVTEAVRYHFNLRSPKSLKPTPIFMVVRVDGKQYKIPTGVKVLPDHWNKKMQVAYVGNRLSLLENSNNLIVNERLDTLIERFSEFLEYLCTVPEQIGNIEILKNHLYMGRSKKVEKTVIQHFKDWCWEKTDSSRPLYQKKVDWLEKYVNTRSDKDNISFSTVATTKFFREFKEWLVVNMKARDGDGVKPDTINETVKKIRTLLGKAVELEFITRTAYNDIVIVTLVDKSDANVPFLYNSEVMQLFRYECKDKTDAIAKDVFLLECTTGQRISDVKGLSENVQEGENGLLILDLLTKKESKRVRVRLLFDIARKILIDKYGYDVPYISDAEINKRIKNIAKEAGLNRTWIKTRHSVTDKTGKATENKQPLYKFITTHVGRHTFDCLLKMRGYSYEDIARYAGHNVDMVKRYTDNCTDVDIDNYELTKVNTPENIVKLISEVDTPKEETTTIQMKQGLSDMGKILEFVNSKLDAFIAIEQINTDTKDFITQNKLDFTWYGGSSFNAYRPKMEKQYKENFKQIISVLDTIMQGMGNAVVNEVKPKPITKAQELKQYISELKQQAEETMKLYPAKEMEEVREGVIKDDRYTEEEKEFCIRLTEKVRFMSLVMSPIGKVQMAIMDKHPEKFFDDFYKRELDDSLKLNWKEIYSGLRQFPDETAIGLLKKASVSPNDYISISEAYREGNENKFISAFSDCSNDLTQYIKAISSLIQMKLFFENISASEASEDDDLTDISDMLSYEAEPLLEETAEDGNLAKDVEDAVIDPITESLQSMNLLSEILEADNDERLDYIRNRIGNHIEFEERIDKFIKMSFSMMLFYFHEMRPVLLRKELGVIDDIICKNEDFKEDIYEMYNTLFPTEDEETIEGETIDEGSEFSLRSDFFNPKNKVQGNDGTYIKGISPTIKEKGIEPLSKLLNYLAENQYIDNTAENKEAFAYLLTGYCKPSAINKIVWNKAPNVLAYILQNFFTASDKWKRVEELVDIKSGNTLHRGTPIRKTDTEDMAFVEFVKPLYPDLKK